MLAEHVEAKNYTSISIDPKQHKSSLRHVHRFLCCLFLVCAVLCVMSIECNVCHVQSTRRQNGRQSGEKSWETRQGDKISQSTRRQSDRQSGKQGGAQRRIHAVTRFHKALGHKVGDENGDEVGDKVGDKVGDHLVTRSHRALGDRVGHKVGDKVGDKAVSMS